MTICTYLHLFWIASSYACLYTYLTTWLVLGFSFLFLLWYQTFTLRLSVSSYFFICLLECLFPFHSQSSTYPNKRILPTCWLLYRSHLYLESSFTYFVFFSVFVLFTHSLNLSLSGSFYVGT